MQVTLSNIITMSRSAFPDMSCPIARSMAQLGDAWRLLIVRDALKGKRRFDEFEASLGVAPNILSQRLGALVEDGLLERQAYQLHPPRYEYVPTKKARDLWPVFVALVHWGTDWLSPEGPLVELIDRPSGHAVDLLLIDRVTKKRVRPKDLFVRDLQDAAAVE